MAVPSSFVGVAAPLADALAHRGFTSLTKVQQAVLDPALRNRDLRISSQTGSGKTVAIGLILADVLGKSAKRHKGGAAKPAALVVAPTRELAAQLGREFDWLYARLGVGIAVVTGGTAIGGDFRSLAKHPPLVIGTPGRLIDLLERGAIDLSATETVVLDEADEMLDMGFRDELERILDQMPDTRTTHLVSATFPKQVTRLADRYQRDAAHVHGTRAGQANDDIEHVAHVVRDCDKRAALINILLASTKRRALVFVRTRVAAADVAGGLASNGFSVQVLSGDLSQRERDHALHAFRCGVAEILVATDVAARGLDVDQISQVIHFDLPDSAQAFTHRSGRTGRAGRKGTNVILVPMRDRRRASRLLTQARVEATWQSLPTANAIREIAVDGLVADLDSAAPATDAERLLAAKLLGDRDPLEVIAALAAKTSFEGPCQPREIASPKGSFAPQNEKKWEKRDATAFTPFVVNWGKRRGANSRKLLAMACRRGGVRGDSIGAIRITGSSAQIDVATSVAPQFQRNAMRPDPRNPKVTIRPFVAHS